MSADKVQLIKNSAAQAELAFARSPHQQRVEAFMRGAKQEVPLRPTVPSDAVLILRAKLIFEEALETINALGVQILVAGTNSGPVIHKGGEFQTAINFPDPGAENCGGVAFHSFDVVAACSMVGVADGVGDIKVVSTGTLSAFGIADQILQEEVDYNNLLKFAEGHSFREDGKLIKPPGHAGPKVAEILRAQGALEEDL